MHQNQNNCRSIVTETNGKRQLKFRIMEDLKQLERVNGIINLKAHLKDAIVGNEYWGKSKNQQEQFLSQIIKTQVYPVHFKK